jgi:two-component system sensor histidine kinase HydH
MASISDTGSGIEPGVQARLFQPFFTTKSKGTGLGLAISKRLIEEHGGAISIASAKGKGSTFTVRLPLDGGKGSMSDEK